jgi:hypothetical protein
MLSTEAANGVGQMTEDRPPPVVIRRLRVREEGDINMMSGSGLVSRSGLSNRRALRIRKLRAVDLTATLNGGQPSCVSVINSCRLRHCSEERLARLSDGRFTTRCWELSGRFFLQGECRGVKQFFNLQLSLSESLLV